MLYLDSLGPDQLQNYDVLHLRSRLDSPAPKPWEQVEYYLVVMIDTIEIVNI